MNDNTTTMVEQNDLAQPVDAKPAKRPEGEQIVQDETHIGQEAVEQDSVG